MTMLTLVVSFLLFLCLTNAFNTPTLHPSLSLQQRLYTNKHRQVRTSLFINQRRREELGLSDEDDEYDLGVALDTNTDPFITKVLAGSLIVVLLGLLVVGVIIPLTQPPDGGMCNPIQNAGRC
mmetsp:Transcript_15664/g.32221  ORF Transcript_15664/g.32221 Transcript_15664/m.32221 type:complete len:123 (-) Transcript_15664:63-431(-)